MAANGLATVCATICAISTADKSNLSATGMLHSHRTDGHTTTIQTWPTYTAKKSSSTSYHPSATKAICEELQRMDSPTSCGTSWTMHTADWVHSLSHGMLHPHRSATCFLYITLCCPIPLQKNLCLPAGGYPPHQKNHYLAQMTHHSKWHN